MPATSTATATRFNPRPLVRRDSGERPGNLHHQVSTHAPLAGSDGATWETSAASSSFNPRSPCGERPAGMGRHHLLRDVSTHAPLAGSDLRVGHVGRGAVEVSTHAPALADAVPVGVSTHAPLAGSDALDRVSCWCCRNKFQPTLPLRGATESQEVEDVPQEVSTHAPLAGSDQRPEGPGG